MHQKGLAYETNATRMKSYEKNVGGQVHNVRPKHARLWTPPEGKFFINATNSLQRFHPSFGREP
jgi:hypothetical protein